MSALLLALALVSTQPGPDAPALVKEGQKLMQAGKLDAAEALFRKAIAADAKLYDGHYGLGRLLDLKGSYAEAREHFEHALATATEDQKLLIWLQTAVSWAFEGKPDEAAVWLQRRFDAEMAAKTLDGAAGTANALARIYLESGQPEKAEQWYRTGYETARQIEKLPADQRDLWDFRWHHAQARIAARRDRHDEARAHAAAAKSILDKGTNPDQASQMPYLTGYLKFHAKDYRGAVADLTKADQTDPFILGLIAHAYEQLGNAGMARAYYTKVLESGAHTINAAYSRPLAQKTLGAGR
ncbi:MAG: tetratricopeptide repeat protein [Vicinamibacterales bacterium]